MQNTVLLQVLRLVLDLFNNVYESINASEFFFLRDATSEGFIFSSDVKLSVKMRAHLSGPAQKASCDIEIK